MSTTTPLPRGQGPGERAELRLSLRRPHAPAAKLHLRARRPDPGNVSSAAIVRAIAAAPEQQQAFLGLTKWLFPTRRGPTGSTMRSKRSACNPPRPSARRQPPGDPCRARRRRAACLSRAQPQLCAGAHFALRQQQHADSTRPLLEGCLRRSAFLLLAHLEPALMARVLDREQGGPDRRADQGDLRGPASGGGCGTAPLLGPARQPGAGAQHHAATRAFPPFQVGPPTWAWPGSSPRQCRRASTGDGRRVHPATLVVHPRPARLRPRRHRQAGRYPPRRFRRGPRLAELALNRAAPSASPRRSRPDTAPRWNPAPARWRGPRRAAAARPAARDDPAAHRWTTRTTPPSASAPRAWHAAESCGSCHSRIRGRTAGGRAASHAASPRPSNSRMRPPARRVWSAAPAGRPCVPSASATPPPIQ